jgi:RimJ/RimL family protein N-acetyltransferase
MNMKILSPKTIPQSLKNGLRLISQGRGDIFWKELTNRLHSYSPAICLMRDITIPFPAPSAKIEIFIRPLEERDIQPLIIDSEYSHQNPRWKTRQLNLVEAQIPQCYVAVDANDRPCFMQWLIGANQNEKIRKHLGVAFPELESHQALLEGAYMHPDFRGMGIMPAAVARISEEASNIGAHQILTFVGIDNIPSLKGCQRAGFGPYQTRHDRWFLFNRNITFKPCTDRELKKFHQAITA